jgi:hypothetical protein
MKVDRRATDWGLLSLWIGGFFLVMAPVQLFFNDFYWSIGIHHAAADEVRNGRIVAPVVFAGFLGLIGFGLFAGFRGMALARATGYPVALPLGGILIGGMDLLLWIGLGLNFMAILGMFL